MQIKSTVYFYAGVASFKAKPGFELACGRAESLEKARLECSRQLTAIVRAKVPESDSRQIFLEPESFQTLSRLKMCDRSTIILKSLASKRSELFADVNSYVEFHGLFKLLENQ